MAPRRRLDAELVRRGLSPAAPRPTTLIERARVLVNGAVADKPAAWSRPATPSSSPVRRLASSAAAARSSTPRSTRSAIDVARAAAPSTPARRRAASPTACCSAARRSRRPRRRPRPAAPAAARRPPGRRCSSARNIRDVDRRRRSAVRSTSSSADLSFISLRVVIPALVALCQPGRRWCCSSSRSSRPAAPEVGRGRGVITDPAIHDRVRDEIDDALVDGRLRRASAGWTRRSAAPRATASSSSTPRTGGRWPP